MLPKGIKMLQLEKLVDVSKWKHWDFQFTDEEYDYFFKYARFTKQEKEVLRLRREEETITAIAFKLGTCESNVNKIIRKIKNKIVRCIVFKRG